jgi:hypothetical protein
MAFQPFGYHFEVRSTKSPSDVKEVLRSRKEGWFDAQRGPRGWILGPFICLWLTASAKDGPMLIGMISRDYRETRISGRAGSNPIGAALIVLFIPIISFFLVRTGPAGGYTPQATILWLAAAVGSGLVMLWFRHKRRREAEPLVAFLCEVLEKPGQPRRAQPVVLPVADSLLKSLSLEVSGSALDGPVSPDSIQNALRELEDGGYVILSSAEERYLQTVAEGDGYIVEKREGDDLHHFQGIRRDDDSGTLTFEEALAVFLAYGSGAPMPAFVEWKAIRP